MPGAHRTAAFGVGFHRAAGREGVVMNSRLRSAATPHLVPGAPTNSALLNYYEAIERASADMLSAARSGDWDQVVKLEGACAVLISQLKHAATAQNLGSEEAQLKSRIMQRI